MSEHSSIERELARLGINQDPAQPRESPDPPAPAAGSEIGNHSPTAPESAEQAVERMLIQLFRLSQIVADGSKGYNAENERLVTDWRDKELRALERRRFTLKNWHEAQAIVARGDAGRAGVVFANRPANSAISWLIEACERVTAFMREENLPRPWNGAAFEQLAHALKLDAGTVEKIRAEANYELTKSSYDPATVQYSIPPGAVRAFPNGLSFVVGNLPGTLVRKSEREREVDRETGRKEAVERMLKANGYPVPGQSDVDESHAIGAGTVPQMPTGKPTSDGAAETPATQRKRRAGRPKKDERDSAAKVIAALNLHHGYDKGSVTNTEPAKNRQLAENFKGLGLAKNALTRFLADKFGEDGYKKYRAACLNTTIGTLLRTWNGETPDHHAALQDEEEGMESKQRGQRRAGRSPGNHRDSDE
ncbi:MAG TPA: hypothetical protein VFE62_23405 [Gemmataceae bacterium]|nr:hypothetical protein [Gemmataceae bacterium]